jgi:hypothetical protein
VVFSGARNTDDCREKGYSDVLYLDAIENKYVEEVSLQYLHCKGSVFPQITPYFSL